VLQVQRPVAEIERIGDVGRVEGVVAVRRAQDDGFQGVPRLFQHDAFGAQLQDRLPDGLTDFHDALDIRYEMEARQQA
jgi:hypothetical protein